MTITAPEMTRFLLSLNEAVDTVFAALRDAAAGEIYVPSAPAATVIDIARALIGERPIELATIGVRPGEKMHEIMVSEEEIHHCVRRGDYYAIRSMLPELRGEAETNALDREFSSADNLLAYEETLRLLQAHRLMIEDGLPEESELLR